jgi:hypothetical protein
VNSLELTLPGDSGHEGSPGWLQHKEGQAENLTEVFGNRLDGEVRPTTKRNEWRWWCSVWGEWSHREEVRWGAAVLGVPFIGRGGSGAEGRRLAAVDF